MESFNRLIVFSQTTDVATVARQLPGGGKTLILTTHYLLENERAQLSGAVIRSFADFPDDDEMERADERAVPRNAGALTSHQYLHEYVPRHLFEKNRRIHTELRKRFTWKANRVYATPFERGNLGISYHFWQSIGAKLVVPDQRFGRKAWAARHLPGTRVERWLQQRQRQREIDQIRELLLLRDGDICWLFFSAKRLHFREGVELTHLPLPAKYFEQPVDHGWLRKQVGEPVEFRAAVPLHQYMNHIAAIRRLEFPTYLFMDAFRPSNYPLPYYAGVFRKVTVVVRDAFDYALFQRAGFPVVRPFHFLKKNWFALPADRDDPVRTVIFSLNHAGDWTALINRADTDVLVDLAAELAASFPNLNFIVRPHPTMARYWNEGTDSLQRFRKFAVWKQLPNFSISDVSLEEDWERGDLFITEYSLSVIDAMKRGKLGLFVNLTGRRSFVVNYQQFGFAHVASRKAVREFLETALVDANALRATQRSGIIAYNQYLSEFLNESIPEA